MKETVGALRDLGKYLRAQREIAEVSTSTLARVAKVSEGYLTKVEKGEERPSPNVLTSLARQLGLRPETLLRKAGYLTGVTASVTEAIKADPRLSEAQKAALLLTYDTMVRDA